MSVEAIKFTKLETRIGYTFKDSDLLKRALTHSSYGDGRRAYANNERLEFLGDRILGLLTAQMLFDRTPDDEGQMARRLNALVRKETCADIARSINLSDAMRVSRSEERQGGLDKTSILGDGCEALLAAIYLDGGMDAARGFYLKFWDGHIRNILECSGKDPKTELQEQASSQKLDPPIYEVIDRSGPDHRPEFTVKVMIKGKGAAEGRGASKKEAERLAAANFLQDWIS